MCLCVDIIRGPFQWNTAAVNVLTKSIHNLITWADLDSVASIPTSANCALKKGKWLKYNTNCPYLSITQIVQLYLLMCVSKVSHELMLYLMGYKLLTVHKQCMRVAVVDYTQPHWFQYPLHTTGEMKATNLLAVPRKSHTQIETSTTKWMYSHAYNMLTEKMFFFLLEKKLFQNYSRAYVLLCPGKPIDIFVLKLELRDFTNGL